MYFAGKSPLFDPKWSNFRQPFGIWYSPFFLTSLEFSFYYLSMSKVACSATTRAGKPCRAWSIHDSDPPLCSAHAGRAGAPANNQNRYVHGFYSKSFKASEIVDLVAHATNTTLEDELAVTRILVQRYMKFLNREEAKIYDYSSIAPHVFAGVRTIALLLRQIETQQSGGPWDEILDQMSEILNVDL